MPRTDGPVLATARAQLRERFDAQQAALDEYIACTRKVAKLQDSMAELLDKQTVALGRLADLTDPPTASQLTGSSLHAAREAMAAHRANNTPASTTVAPTDGDRYGG